MPSPGGLPDPAAPPSPSAIQLLISDIDGTLVTPDKVLTVAARAAVQRLREAGIGFSIVSARPPRGMLAVATALGVRLPFAAFNGGSLVDPDLRTISAKHLSPDVARSALALLSARQVAPWVFADGDWRLQDPNGAEVERERRTLGFGPRVVGGFDEVITRIDKIVGVSDDHDHLAAVGREMAALLGGGANALRSQAYYLDITPPGADKGHAVRAICEHAGVPLANTAVIGDMHNDIAMFRVAGVAIAMGQSDPDVRAAAHLTTASNSAEGFAKAINRFVLPMRGEGEAGPNRWRSAVVLAGLGPWIVEGADHRIDLSARWRPPTWSSNAEVEAAGFAPEGSPPPQEGWVLHIDRRARWRRTLWRARRHDAPSL